MVGIARSPVILGWSSQAEVESYLNSLENGASTAREVECYLNSLENGASTARFDEGLQRLSADGLQWPS